MATIKTRDGTEIFYKDWGEGRPVVLSHGWPLNADAWDEQLFFLASNGYGAIAHVRDLPPDMGRVYQPLESRRAIYEEQLRRQRRLYTKLFEEN